METLKKILKIIPNHHKYKLLILMILLVFAMFLEVLGIGLLVPIITFILDDEKSKIYFDFVNQYLGNYSNEYILYFTLSILIFTFAFKTIFLTILNYRQNRFLATIKIYLTNLLFSSYILENYNFYLKNNISNLIKNVSKEVGIVHSLGTTYLSIIVEGSLILASVFTVVYINPLGAITIGLFLFASSYLFFYAYKKRIHIYGEKRKQYDKDLAIHYYESFSNIKELKVFNKEINVINKHEDLIQNQTYLSAYVDFIVQSPRYFLEFISIFALLIFIISSLLWGEGTNALIVSVGVFVTAIFKMLPSVNKLLSVSQTINYNKPALDLIYEELLFKSDSSNENLGIKKIVDFKQSITLENVSFSYKKNNKVLDQLNFKINKGEIIGIIGQSGSGKTTFIDLLLGLHKHSKGLILIDDQEFSPEKQKIDFISYVPQEIILMDKTVKENIVFFDKNFDESRFNNAVEKSGLKNVIENLPDKEDTLIGDKGNNLSGGQRQRIGIARALYKSPQLLIFDEGTSSLDSVTEDYIFNSLYQLRGLMSMIIISHKPSTLKNCDIVYEMINGSLITKNNV